MKNLGLLFSIILLSTAGVRGQDNLPQVLNATGNYTLVNNYMVDYSVGEMTAVETFTFGNSLLTQGFLQPLTIPEGTGEFGSDIEVLPDMSPNNDGLGNETLHIKNIENYPVNDIQIFNRWGNLVFKMSGYDNADNSFKGIANTGMFIGDKELPDGTYYYILKAFIPNVPTTETHTGFFVIKRK